MDNIDLSFSYMRIPPPKSIIKIIKTSLNNINKYPSGDYTELKEKLSNYVGAIPKNIIVGDGSDEIIDMITRAFGDKVLIPTPTFSEYEESAQRRNSIIKKVNSFDGENYKINFSKKDIKNSTLIWICSPNNPTGTIVPKETIEEIVSQTKSIVAIDETFFEYSRETSVPLLKKYNNIIIIRSLSKSFGIAGLRLGYAISNDKNIKILEKYRRLFNVNIIAETVGIKIFNYVEYYENAIKKIKNIKDNFTNAIEKIGFHCIKSNAPFVFVAFKNIDEMKFYYNELIKFGIKTFPSYSKDFSNSKIPFIRVSIGTENEMKKMINVIKQIQSNYRF
ncbi:MAG: pyridoxal phosphate-dependent aminotransferase [Candidatus Micrarchaeia archaeon]